jgi:hypothetical protein
MGARPELLDGVVTGSEGLFPMRGRDHDGHAALAHADLAHAVDDGQPGDAETDLDLGGDLPQHAEHHRLKCLVAQALHALAHEARGLVFLARRGCARRVARLADEEDDRPIGRSGDLAAQLAEERIVDRVLTDLDAAQTRASLFPSGDRRDVGQLVVAREWLVGVDIASIPGEPDAVSRGTENRERRHQRPPGGSHVGPLLQLEHESPPADLDAVHGEESNVDAHA